MIWHVSRGGSGSEQMGNGNQRAAGYFDGLPGKWLRVCVLLVAVFSCNGLYFVVLC